MKIFPKFFPSETEFIYVGQPYLDNNNLGFRSHYNGDTVIQLGGWGQELNVDSENHTIVSFEAIFSPKVLKKTRLTVPKYTDSKIKFDVIRDMKTMKIYYDDKNGWFCFGNKDYHGKGYRFATDTIAVIHNNDLEAIFVKPRKETD